jgi:hypothetical protein
MQSTPTRAGIAEAQDAAQNIRNFEYRAIFDVCDGGAIIIQAARDFGHALTNVFEGVQHDSGVTLLHPFGVVSLLRHGPCISHHDDRQPLLHGFADTARTGFADKEIAELHEVADLTGKSNHGAGSPGRHRA